MSYCISRTFFNPPIHSVQILIDSVMRYKWFFNLLDRRWRTLLRWISNSAFWNEIWMNMYLVQFWCGECTHPKSLFAIQLHLIPNRFATYQFCEAMSNVRKFLLNNLKKEIVWNCCKDSPLKMNMMQTIRSTLSRVIAVILCAWMIFRLQEEIGKFFQKQNVLSL